MEYGGQPALLPGEHALARIRNRARAAFSADYRARLGRIDVPTLIITPEHDELIGEQAAHILLAGIPDAREIVLPRTGHMFRFSHPLRYAEAIAAFLADRVDDRHNGDFRRAG